VRNRFRAFAFGWVGLHRYSSETKRAQRLEEGYTPIKGLSADAEAARYARLCSKHPTAVGRLHSRITHATPGGVGLVAMCDQNSTFMGCAHSTPWGGSIPAVISCLVACMF
jgi:hypothetical protein